jgi:hypothetical protein
MNANEAFEITKGVYTYEKCIELITARAEAGFYSLSVEGFLTDEIQKELEETGLYLVTNEQVPQRFHINWEQKEGMPG